MKSVKKMKNKKLNNIMDWIFHLVLYTTSFMLIASLFDNIYVDKNNIILWSSIIVLVLYILNKTIKPILVTLTIPITGLTLGLFYPFINVLILKITDWILGNLFEINYLFVAFLFAILLSISNFISNEIIKKIGNKVKSR